ncbi:hypothetical protein D8674_018339 [Pyrus ussuriensis x Pyrus communis]|uniref:Uncharacterized protein n=1 Tax=Pyrus ussuriensis x Pyrus communis TaxID=2448454 RepID=A0A5N5G549_9ROSA|nr:hypothetical protein D8674_018339 [Pyrus ussuriensis x Pyrus communis]
MNRVPDIAISVPLDFELEGTSEERSTKVHKYICSFIAMLGGFLQLKQGAKNESLFNTNYPAMVSLIIALTAYIGSLIGSRILHVQARPNSYLAESIINKISLLLGILVLILEVVILVPGLGLVAGFFWVVWFVKVVVEYACEYLKTLDENAVASVLHTFRKLKDFLNMIIRHFTTKPKEETDDPTSHSYTSMSIYNDRPPTLLPNITAAQHPVALLHSQDHISGSQNEHSTKVHKYICSLIAMLGGFLQLKQGARNESLFNTDYPVMVSLIVTLIAYIGSLIGSIILHVQARPNSDLAESIINKISLLLGTLALILEVVILVPGLGLVAGFFWVVWFVKIVVEYTCEYLKALYKNAVASVVHSFGKLRDYLNMIIRRFATKPKEQTNELPQVTSTKV